MIPICFSMSKVKCVFLAVILMIQGFSFEKKIEDLEQSVIQKYAMIEKKEYEDSFIGIFLVGRLGNHFFHLATGLAYAWEHGLTPVCPQLFGNPSDAACRQMEIGNAKYIYSDVQSMYGPVYENLLSEYPEVASSYLSKQAVFLNPNQFGLNPPSENSRNIMMAVDVFFQENYFLKYKQKIKKIFQPSEKISFVLSEKYPDLYQNTDSIGLHYRDITGDGDDAFKPIRSSYYIKALNMFEEKKCCIFSNNLNKAKSFFSTIQKKTPQKEFYFIRTERDYLDFYLLSSFKNIIMCNSTFSWWAAYLSPFQDKKIICPKINRWFLKSFQLIRKETLLPTSENWIYL